MTQGRLTIESSRFYSLFLFLQYITLYLVSLMNKILSAIVLFALVGLEGSVK